MQSPRLSGAQCPGFCTGCGTCTHSCRERAIEVRVGVIVLPAGTCMECGFCIRPSPFHIILEPEPEYRLTAG